MAKESSTGRMASSTRESSKTTSVMELVYCITLAGKSLKVSGRLEKRTEDAFTLGRMELGTILSILMGKSKEKEF